jgi:hypothetical protein
MMHWALALLAVATSTFCWACPQDDDGEKLYRSFEAKIIRAKSFRVAFTIHQAQTNRPEITRKGEILVAENKFRIEVSGTEGEKAFSAKYICDGSKFVSVSIADGETTTKTRSASEKQTPIVKLFFAELGMLANFDSRGGLATKPFDPEKYKLAAFRSVGKEKLDGSETDVFEFDLTGGELPSSSIKVNRKIWFDAKTHLPQKRAFESRKGDLVYNATEVYANWDFDFNTRQGDFTLAE